MRILIWGTGGLTRRYMKFEYFVGHDILGFVDSYAEYRSFMGYPVYGPSEVGAMEYDYLLVCVAKDNIAILRTCIVENLDLERMVFLNERVEFESAEGEYAQRILCIEDVRNLFPAIYRDRKELQKKKEYYCNPSNFALEEKTLIQKIGDASHAVVWVPVELLFSERAEDNYLDTYTQEWLEQNRKLENIPIPSFAPYRNLFSFFMRGNEEPVLYCEWYQRLFSSRGTRSGYSDEQLIEKRFREFKIMQQELNKGMGFFIANPAIAKWNKRRGCFNLVDGHHRTAFLYYSGLSKIPVQITWEDYETWCNLRRAEEVRDIIARQQRREFYQPILNPYFLHIHSHREEYTKSRLHHLLEVLDAKWIEGKKLIDIGANLGYMGQAFCRMGAEVTLLEPDCAHYELMTKINDLLYTNCRAAALKFEEYETDEVFDIAILLTVFYHYFSIESVRDAFIRHLNKNVSRMVIWESGDLPDKEKAYIMKNTKFCNYKHICYTYASGKFRELGIFMSGDSESAQAIWGD